MHFSCAKLYVAELICISAELICILAELSCILAALSCILAELMFISAALIRIHAELLCSLAELICIIEHRNDTGQIGSKNGSKKINGLSKLIKIPIPASKKDFIFDVKPC